MSTLSHRHDWTIRHNDGVVCSCAVPNPRHTSGVQCFTRAQVEAFKREHGLVDEGHCRALMYLETFASQKGNL